MVIAGFNDPKLADAAGTTKQQIFKLRKGQRKLTVEWARRLAPHLGLRWEALVEGPQDNGDADLLELQSSYDTLPQDARTTLLAVARSLVAAHGVTQDQPPGAPSNQPPGTKVPPRPFVGEGVAQDQSDDVCHKVVRIPHRRPGS